MDQDFVNIDSVPFTSPDSPHQDALLTAPLQIQGGNRKIHDATILLVNGYIRRLDNLLGDECIVPSSVYELCCTFYTVNVPLILWSRWTEQDQMSQFGAVNIDNLSAFSLKYNDDNKRVAPLCHIPSISRSLPNDMVSGSTFDAVLVTEPPPYPWTNPAHFTMSLLLYDAVDTSTKQIVNVQYEFTHSLNHEMWTQNQFIFCPQRNNVIYEHKANLYEMEFNNIKT